MRGLGCVALVVALALASAARAEDDDSRLRANALVEEGNQLGAQGKHRQAIAKFKAAEALLPRALHNCNIGLAFSLLEEWEKAHLYLSRCQSRWDPADGAAPDWLAGNLAGVEGKLRTGDYGTIRITTDPTDATVVLSPFPGKAIVERKLWVAAGQHRLRITADGHVPAEQKVEVERGAERAISIVLDREPPPDEDPELTATPGPEPMAVAEPVPERRRASRPWLYAGISTAAVGAALVGGGFVFRMRANDNVVRIESAESAFLMGIPGERGERDLYEQRYDDAKSDLDTNNALMVASWIGGGVALAAGTYMIVHAFTGASEPAESGPAFTVSRTGASASWSWSF